MLKRDDVVTGAIFVLIALLFGAQSLHHDLGSFFKMGPGMFPLLVSGLLAMLGVLIAINGISNRDSALSGFAMRPLVLVVGAPVAFAFTVRPFGLIPAATIVVLMACLASSRMTLRRAGAVVVVLVALATVIFHFGLRLPMPLFGPWLRGT